MHIDGGQTVSVMTSWFPPAISAEAPRLADSKPFPAGVVAYITEVTGDRTVSIVEEWATVLADEDVARQLKIPPKSPVLVNRARQCTSTGQVILYTETSTRSGLWRTRTYIVTSR
jgi:DNA-binding GntR family transcriptional regulator